MPKIYAAVDAFNQEVRDAGSLGVRRRPGADHDVPRWSTRPGAEPVVTDGPFAESKEYLGGFWVIEAADLDDALDWAKRGSAACAGPVEVRPFQAEPA